MNKNYFPKGTNDTVFNPQLQHFDFICGQIMKENKILRFVCVVACISFLLSIANNFYASSLPDSVPVLITMNDFGQTTYLGEVRRKNYQNFKIPEVAITYQIKDFLNLAFTMSTDRIVMKKNIERAYHLLTSTSGDKFSNYLKERNPFEGFGTYTNDVTFETEPLALSKNTYQIDFIVTRRLTSGDIDDARTLRAVVSVDTMQPPKSDLKQNPLGIYISNFDIKEIAK